MEDLMIESLKNIQENIKNSNLDDSENKEYILITNLVLKTIEIAFQDEIIRLLEIQHKKKKFKNF